MPTMKYFSIFILSICLFPSLGFQNKPDLQQASPLFADEEILELSLKFSVDSLLRDRGKDPSYFAAKMTIKNGKEKQDLALKVKVRGNFRRNPENCNFPPIRLNFKKEHTGETVFVGQDKLKLVTHCSEERFILKEYLAYKAYQLINPQGFKVRLARVTYIDQNRVHKTTKRYAFIIEDKDAMATRLGGTAVPDSVSFTEKQTLHHETAQLYLFQYLLGNRDWDISMKKNVKLVKKASGEVLALPYDFDFTGWVSAPYTVAYMGSLAKNFEYRSGRKFCATEEEWEKHIQHFLDKKADLIALINNFKPLPKKEKASMIAFIEAFYDEITKPNKVVELFGDC